MLISLPSRVSDAGPDTREPSAPDYYDLLSEAEELIAESRSHRSQRDSISAQRETRLKLCEAAIDRIREAMEMVR